MAEAAELLGVARGHVYRLPTVINDPGDLGVKLLDHYGPPNETTPAKLFWYRVGPWARMELTADQVLLDFPTPHTDFLTQYVDYPVRANKGSELVEFDGSLIVDRTADQIGARCDHEAYNTLSINLAVEILEGRRTVEDARRLLAETASAFVLGRDAPYPKGWCSRLSRQTLPTRTSSIIASGMAHQSATI